MPKPITILLVEDNPDDVELTLRAFKKAKLKNNVIVVRDGQEALDYIYHQGAYQDKDKAPTPGLILLDLKLPRVDGIEVLRKLKSVPQKRRIPVVVLTISEREVDIVKSYDLGANSYIIKPVDFDKFMDTVQNINLYWVLTNTSPLLED
jgi:CheY-like chemotaxis protein